MVKKQAKKVSSVAKIKDTPKAVKKAAVKAKVIPEPMVEKPKRVRRVRVVMPQAFSPKPTPTSEPKKILPIFDGKQIISVLPNKAPKGFVLCEAMDGNTKVTIHVPKSVF